MEEKTDQEIIEEAKCVIGTEPIKLGPYYQVPIQRIPPSLKYSDPRRTFACVVFKVVDGTWIFESIE